MYHTTVRRTLLFSTCLPLLPLYTHIFSLERDIVADHYLNGNGWIHLGHQGRRFHSVLSCSRVAADKSAHSQLPEPRLHTVAHTASSDYLQQCCVCDWDHTGIFVPLFAAGAGAAAVVDRVGIAVDSFGKAYRRVTVVAALILMYHVMLSDSD